MPGNLCMGKVGQTRWGGRVHACGCVQGPTCSTKPVMHSGCHRDGTDYPEPDKHVGQNYPDPHNMRTQALRTQSFAPTTIKSSHRNSLFNK